MLDIFTYGFMVRGFIAGIIIAIIAPLIGIFLVLRRYSLIADTLAHVSLAGIAFGLLLGINPMITALIATGTASLNIERLRTEKKIYGESALAIFLSGSLAIAVVVLGFAHGLTANLFSYLFGSIVTVSPHDVIIVSVLGMFVIIAIRLFYKELVAISFDEEAAKVSGIPARRITMLLILLSALTVSLAIPIVGILLISALIVIPVLSALQLNQSFGRTLMFAELFSITSVLIGIIASFYLNLPTGGTIVLIALTFFITTLVFKKR